MGQVSVPGFQHAPHPGRVAGVPRDRSPVDVPDEDAPSRPHDATELAQSAPDVLHVLEDLDAERSVKASVRQRQGACVALMEGHVRAGRGTSRGDLEHGRAWIDAGDRPRVADLFGKLVDIEARPAADVDDPFSGPGPEGLAYEAPAALHVARRVERLQLGDHLLVEDDLAHRSAQVRAD